MRLAEQPCFDPVEHMGRRCHLGKFVIQCGKAGCPEIAFRLQGRVGRYQSFHPSMLGWSQQAQDVFSYQRAALVTASALLLFTHAVRHSLSLIRLRRSQVRIVLSGTEKRCANSS